MEFESLTFPAPSLTHAYRVCTRLVPGDESEYDPAAGYVVHGVHVPDAGFVEDSVTIHATTPTLSEALRLKVIAGLFVGVALVMENAVTWGSEESNTTSKVDALLTFPAASFAHAYTCFVPLPPLKVKDPPVIVSGVIEATLFHEGSDGAGAVADSFTTQPVTPTLSVAVRSKLIKEFAVGDALLRVKTVIVGGSTSMV